MLFESIWTSFFSFYSTSSTSTILIKRKGTAHCYVYMCNITYNYVKSILKCAFHVFFVWKQHVRLSFALCWKQKMRQRFMHNMENVCCFFTIEIFFKLKDNVHMYLISICVLWLNVCILYFYERWKKNTTYSLRMSVVYLQNTN